MELEALLRKCQQNNRTAQQARESRYGSIPYFIMLVLNNISDIKSLTDGEPGDEHKKAPPYKKRGAPIHMR